MARYKNVLCAIDLSASTKELLQTALELTDNHQEQVHAIYVCEHPITGYGETTGQNHPVTEAQIRQQHFPALRNYLEDCSIAIQQGHIVFGQVADEVHQLASELNCDLIIVGGHGKSGIERLLGSVSSRIQHGARCDVLSVRIEGK